MLRSDFDTHPLWNVLTTVDQQLQEILDAHQPDDLPPTERIRSQMAYVRSFDVVASTRSAFFHSQMLDNVQSVWSQVSSSLGTRISNGIAYSNYVMQAADQAETGLMQMAAWPRPYGKGGEVKQMNTLFEQLLEAQRESIAALNAEHARLRQEIATYSEAVEAKSNEVNGELGGVENKLTDLETVIEAQKSEVVRALESAETSVEGLTAINDERYTNWRTGQEDSFGRDFDGLRDQIAAKLDEASIEYDELLNAKAKYTKLVSAIAADEVASQFEAEAGWGRKLGNRFYLLGFGLLIAAAVPLVALIFEGGRGNNGDIDWTAIIVRLSIGVLAGSAATVAIRLGGRLINNANAIKRMELELRAIGPFLANVTEKPKVDDAFIDLVAKAFGNSYAETASTGGKDTPEDKTPATAATQLLELLQRASKASPPSA